MDRTALLTLLFLCSCGNTPDIEPFVIEFENYYDVQVMVDFEFSDDLGSNTFGLCDIHEGNPFIQINRDRWCESTDILRVVLVYHELGHCHFGLNHNHSMLSNGNPVSYMWSDLSPAAFRDPSLVQYYKEELGHRAAKLGTYNP